MRSCRLYDITLWNFVVVQTSFRIMLGDTHFFTLGIFRVIFISTTLGRFSQ